MATGQEEMAAKCYQRILEIDSTEGAACYELSRIVASDGMADSAILLAQRAVRSDKKNIWYQLHLATLYRSTNQYKDHITVWETLTKQYPEVIDYYFELSNAYILDNNIKKAIGILDEVERRIGVTEAVSIQKSKLWRHLGNESKALQEIEKLAKTMPMESRYNVILAESYMASKQYGKAKECYDRVLAANPDDEYVHISLAEYYKATNQPRKAYEELLIVMAQKNMSTANKLQLLTNFYTSDEFYGSHSSYAFDLLEAVMRNSDDSTSYAAFYGDVLMRQNRYSDAARQFALALSADSSKYELWEALLISEMSAETDTALLAGHARKASRLFPLHPLPYYAQAVVAHDNLKYSTAIDLLANCEKMGFDNGYLEPEVYRLTAECYNRLDDSRCYDYFDRYLKIRPNDLLAMNSYAYRMAQDKRNLERALTMSRRTIEAEPDNHYYLDTYAWILHQSGRDKEALPYIEKAVRIATQAGTIDDEEKEHLEIIRNSSKQ